jgi:pyruvate/2-oxoglutarate/acetoin dehydrogenase E1 component
MSEKFISKELTYKDKLTETMTWLSDQGCVFIGYNVGCGNKAGGTLKGVGYDNLYETPLAENLMAGIAIGMGIEGNKTVFYF